MSRRNDANQKQNYCWFAVRILYLGSVTVDLSVDRKLLGALPIAHCPLPVLLNVLVSYPRKGRVTKACLVGRRGHDPPVK